MTLPNFLIIGAHKAATSSLYRYLKEHPDVYMPTLKEARFFSYDPNVKPRSAHWAEKIHLIKTMEEYEALFDGVTTEKAIGEASPDYLNTEICPQRIQETVPEAKLIVSLRNPADRVFSVYQMAVRDKQISEPFENLFRKVESWGARRNGYYDRLKRFYDRFDRKQIKVVLFEDIGNDAATVMADLFRYLEVDDSFEPNVGVRYNPGGKAKNQLLYSLFKNRKAREFFKPLVPERFHSLITNVRDSNLQAVPPLKAEVRKLYLQDFEEDILKVQDLIDLDLSSWLAAASEQSTDKPAEDGSRRMAV